MEEIDFGRWLEITLFESTSGMLLACKCEYSVTKTLMRELLSPLMWQAKWSLASQLSGNGVQQLRCKGSVLQR